MFAGLSADGLAILTQTVLERQCREEVGFGSFADAAAPCRPEPPCPMCHAEHPRRWGREANGPRRHVCGSCGRRHDSLMGTVLEFSRSDMPTWASIVHLMRLDVPLDTIAKVCRVSHQTARGWRRRLSATVDVHRDRLVPRDRAWVTEACVTDTGPTHGYGEARKRSLSKQKACVAVAVGVHKNPVAVVCGHGKPSPKRVREGLERRIVEGSTVAGDKERALDAPARAVRGTHESYKADVGDPVHLEQVAMADNLCAWIKRCLWRFTGMEMKCFQSYFNWYVYLFRMKRARDRWPAIARMVHPLTDGRHAFPQQKNQRRPTGWLTVRKLITFNHLLFRA